MNIQIRSWLTQHCFFIAVIDRFTGQVIDKQIEEVTE